MSEQIKTSYRGVEIIYNETLDIWSCEHSPRGYAHESLQKVKERIDKWIKHESTFERFTAIRKTLCNYDSQQFGDIVTVTSKTDEGDIWVTKGCERSKIDGKYISSHIVADTEENRAMVNQVNELRASEKRIQNEILAIIAAMEPVSFEVKK